MPESTLASKAEVAAALATGEWIAKFDTLRQRTYYVNPHTRQSTWNLAKTLATLHPDPATATGPAAADGEGNPGAARSRRPTESMRLPESKGASERVSESNMNKTEEKEGDGTLSHPVNLTESDNMAHRASPAAAEATLMCSVKTLGNASTQPPPSTTSTVGPHTPLLPDILPQRGQREHASPAPRGKVGGLATISSASLTDGSQPRSWTARRDSLDALSNASAHPFQPDGSTTESYTEGSSGSHAEVHSSFPTMLSSTQVTPPLLPRRSSVGQVATTATAPPSVASAPGGNDGRPSKESSPRGAPPATLDSGVGGARAEASLLGGSTNLGTVSVSTMSDTQFLPTEGLSLTSFSRNSSGAGALQQRRPGPRRGSGQNPLLDRAEHPSVPNEEPKETTEAPAPLLEDPTPSREGPRKGQRVIHHNHSSSHSSSSSSSAVEVDSEEEEERQLTEELHRLESEKARLASEVSVLRAPVEAEATRLRAAEASLEATQKSLADAVDAAVARREEKQRQLATLQARNKLVLQEKESNKATFLAYEQRRRQLEARRATVLAELANLDQQVNQMNDLAAAARQAATALSPSGGTLQEQVAAAVAQLTQHRERVAQLRVAVAERNTALAQAEAALVELKREQADRRGPTTHAQATPKTSKEGEGIATQAPSTAAADHENDALAKVKAEYVAQREHLQQIENARRDVQAILLARRMRATLTTAQEDAQYTVTQTHAVCAPARKTLAELNEVLASEEAVLVKMRRHHEASMAYLDAQRESVAEWERQARHEKERTDGRRRLHRSLE